MLISPVIFYIQTKNYHEGTSMQHTRFANPSHKLRKPTITVSNAQHLSTTDTSVELEGNPASCKAVEKCTNSSALRNLHRNRKYHKWDCKASAPQHLESRRALNTLKRQRLLNCFIWAHLGIRESSTLTPATFPPVPSVGTHLGKSTPLISSPSILP